MIHTYGQRYTHTRDKERKTESDDELKLAKENEREGEREKGCNDREQRAFTLVSSSVYIYNGNCQAYVGLKAKLLILYKKNHNVRASGRRVDRPRRERSVSSFFQFFFSVFSSNK